MASGPEGRKIKRRQISFDCQYSSIFLANVEKRKSWMFFLILHIDTDPLRIDIALVTKIGNEVILGGKKHQIVYNVITWGDKQWTFSLKTIISLDFRFYILYWQVFSLGANFLHFGKNFLISSLSWPCIWSIVENWLAPRQFCKVVNARIQVCNQILFIAWARGAC